MKQTDFKHYYYSDGSNIASDSLVYSFWQDYRSNEGKYLFISLAAWANMLNGDFRVNFNVI